MRATCRQPIYLAKLKKRDKQNAVNPDYKLKDSIQYDLMLFQESLHLKDQQKIDVPITMRTNSFNRKPFGQNSKILNQTMEIKNLNMQNKKKLKNDPLQRSTAPIFQKCMFNKHNFELKNVHKTQASTKPKAKSITQTCINIIQNKNQSNQLSYLRMMNPKLTISTIENKNKAIVQKIVGIELARELNLVKFEQNNQQSPENMKNVYQKKIEQLQQLNTKNIEIIKQLQQVNHMHSNQNIHLLQRIQHIQHEFDQLLNNHRSLKELETNQENTNEVTVLKFFRQQHSQTEEIIEKKSRLQSFNRNQSHSSRSSLQLSSQDWIIRAKQLKNQLQLQKIHSFNLQAAYNVQIQNKKIQWRQKMQAMQRQIQSMNTRYQRKCTEVKQKDQLITRLINK